MRHMLALAAALATALMTPVVAQQPASPALPNAPITEPRPAPAFKAGDPVTDSTGVEVGKVATLTESDTGPVVVISIDAKMVGVPQSTLKLEGERVISSQTKAQMLAAAGAPR